VIGIDRQTGRTLTGWQQLVSRVQQVMTTPIGAREKRRAFGSSVPTLQGKNMNDDLLMMAQVYAIEAFYNPENGLDDFQPTQCVATRRVGGLTLTISGIWQGQQSKMEVLV
jgi:hypothetical protein